MKVAYLVFAYKNPQLLAREIAMLSFEESSFFIHIDQKSRIEDFALIRGENIFFSKERIPVYWAEFSGVQAILRLMTEALEGPHNYDYFVLLSGSEYPLRSRSYIHTFLAHHQGSEFISMLKMPAPGKPISRLNIVRPQSVKPVRRLAMRAFAKAGLAQRDYRQYLGNLEPYSGITWWALTRKACKYILSFVRRNQHVVDYFQDVFAPEETFFHTILGNSPFRSRIQRNLLYEDWSIPGGHPAMIASRHLTFFESLDEVRVSDLYSPGELLFARKFSDDTLDLVQRLDDMINRKERRPNVGSR